MSTVLALSGSLREGSVNTHLVRAAVELAPAGMKIDVYEGLRSIPPFDQDQALSARPAPVNDLMERMRAADGLLVSTPEYNYGPPGVLKNAIDWVSFPPPESPLAGKPIGLMGASPTNFGTVRAQLALRQSFLWTDSRVVGKPEVQVFRAQDRFDDEGTLTDPGTRQLVGDLLAALQQLLDATAPAA